MIHRSTLEDTRAITGAATPDRLWRYLVAHPTLRALPNGFEAMVAFRRVNQDGRSGAMRTAGLLCTDMRWRRVTAALIADFEETRILSETELDALAEGFLWHDAYGWPVPAGWLRDGTVRLRGRRPSGRPGEFVLERQVAAPLRRWAAARVASRWPERTAEVLARVTELDSRAGDAAMAGVLDVCEAFPVEARDVIVELGCTWMSGAVRLRALRLLALRDRDEVAKRAAHDPSAKVRNWAERLVIQRPHGDSDPDTIERPDAVSDGSRQRSEQFSLFG